MLLVKHEEHALFIFKINCETQRQTFIHLLVQIVKHRAHYLFSS